MKIIDSHVHIGSISNWNFSMAALSSAMEKYYIDFALVSNIAGSEFISETEANCGDQKSVNEVVRDWVVKHPRRFNGLFWIRPHLEGYNQEIETYLKDNRDCFCGLKVHPSQSRLAFTTENHQGYLAMGARLKLPIVVHSEADSYSNPALIYQTAQENPAIDFIMVHLGLRTDHKEAIRFVKDLPNLYGDTTFVDNESVMQAIRVCGSEKILFGTDAPTLGIDTYHRYEALLKSMEHQLSPAGFENVIRRNAIKLFKLNEVSE